MRDINDTGTRGFLKWLQADQPGIYARIAPNLPRLAPQLFSDFEAGGAAAGAHRRAAGMGDVTLQPIDVTATGTVPTVDVADAANSTATDGGTASWLSSLINGVSSAYMTVTQANTNQQIVNAQLQRAAQGLPPLSISSGAAGVPTITAGASSSSLLIWGGLALLAGVAFLASRRR